MARKFMTAAFAEKRANSADSLPLVSRLRRQRWSGSRTLAHEELNEDMVEVGHTLTPDECRVFRFTADDGTEVIVTADTRSPRSNQLCIEMRMPTGSVVVVFEPSIIIHDVRTGVSGVTGSA